MEERIINEPYGFIYITTNMVNGRKYLGQKGFDKDWKSYLGSGTAFKKAIEKYGKDNFSRNIMALFPVAKPATPAKIYNLFLSIF